MKHLKLTTKKNTTILVHPDEIKEAYPSQDGKHTIVVVGVRNRKGDDTFLAVAHTVDEIEAMMERKCGRCLERDSEGDTSIR